MASNLHVQAKKIDNRPNFGESHFWSSGSLEKAFSSYFLVISMFSVTRRAGWAHLNSKSNTVFGNLQNQGLRYSDKAKDLKLRLKLGSFVQIWI